MDGAGGLYFAQARRYDAGRGGFVSEDRGRGFIGTPFTLNVYGYCWNRPLDLVDLDGNVPTDGITDTLEGSLYELNYSGGPSAGVTSEVGKILSESADLQDEKAFEIGLNWPAFETDSALISDISYGADAGTGVLKDSLISNTVINKLLENRPANIGVGTYVKNVTQDVGYCSKWLNGMSKGAKAIGTVAVLVDVGGNMYSNYESGASATKMISDVAVDASVDVVSILAASAATGWLMGSVFPGAGNLFGAVVGIIVGLGIYMFTDVITINGKSFRDWFKESSLALFNSIGAWMTDSIENIKQMFAGQVSECLE